MDEFFGMVLMAWISVASIGAIDNMLFQTPDKRIITSCEKKGYLNVNQEVILCKIADSNELKKLKGE